LPTVLPRSAWTGVTKPTTKLTPLKAAAVRGFAVHYTGSAGKLGSAPTEQTTARRLRDTWEHHVRRNGWTDIAYQYAVDQAGRVFELRGARYRSAANGNADVNAHWGAITVLVGVDDDITPAVVEALRWWRTHVWLTAYPHATKIVGHRDLNSTLCPGDRLYRLIATGALMDQPARPPTPTPEGDDDMPLTDADAQKVADAVTRDLLGQLLGRSGPTVGVALQETHQRIQHASLLDAHEIAAAVSLRYPHGVDVPTLAKAIVDEINTRLVR
jgi:hypothetical protein